MTDNKDIVSLLQAGESQAVEFKSSFVRIPVKAASRTDVMAATVPL